MKNEKIEGLLKAIAKKLGDNGYCSYRAVENELRPVLAPLLEAGEAMRDTIEQNAPHSFQDFVRRWDAELSLVAEKVSGSVAPRP